MNIFIKFQEALSVARIFIITCVLLNFFFVIYWTLIASDRYVSTAHIQVNRTDLRPSSVDIASMLTGQNDNNRSDLLLLRDYLLSEEMLLKLDAKFNLKLHYSDSGIDLISRMWSVNNPLEWFHRYYLSSVQIELDEFSGLLIIKTEGFTPLFSKQMADMLVLEGELFLNQSAHKLARSQVDFLVEQVESMGERAMKARQAVLDFQNRKNLVSPQTTAESTQAIINSLEAKLSELQIERNSLSSYLLPGHASLLLIAQQIKAVESQIADQKARLTSTKGRTLNEVVEEMQRLQAQALFAEEVYKSALITLEKGRLEALRTIKMVSLVRPPVLPEYPMQPRRLYNTLLSITLTWMLGGIMLLLVAVIKDHQE